MIRKCVWGLVLGCSLLFCGCQQREGDAVRTEMQDEGKYTYVSLYSDVDFWNPPIWDTTDQTMTGQITRKTGVVLDVTVPVQKADRRLSMMLLNDKLPDLISVTDATVISQLSGSGKVWNLQDFLETYCPDSHILKDFPEDLKNELICRDGAWYAYASHINSADAREYWKPCGRIYEEREKYSYNNGILWNKKLLDAIGLSVEDVQTEEQVLGAMDKIKTMELEVGGKKVIPLLLDGQDYIGTTLDFMMNTFGGEYLDDEGNYQDILTQKEAKHALQFLNYAVRKGYCSSEQITWSNTAVKEYLASGRVLCFIGNLANTGVDFRQWISSGPVLSSSGERPVLGKNGRSSTGWISTFVSKSCEHPEQVAAWLDYMTSEEGMTFWEYGYENEDYIRNEDGLIVRTMKGQGKARNYEETGMGIWWMFTNWAWERSVEQEPEEGSSEALELEAYMSYGKNEHTAIYENYGMYNIHESIPQEGAPGKIQANIDAWKQSQIPRILLAKSEDAFEKEYETFMQKLEDLDIHALDEEKNKIYLESCREYGIIPQKINEGVFK